MDDPKRIVELTSRVMADLGHNESFINAVAVDLRIGQRDALGVLTTLWQAMDTLDWRATAEEFTDRIQGASWDDLDEDAQASLVRGMRAGFAFALGTRMCREAQLLDEEQGSDFESFWRGLAGG